MLRLVALALFLAALATTASAVDQPAPPTKYATAYSPPSGAVIPVAAGGNLQAAIDQAQPGQIIELEAGATFTGNFVLPNKGNADWIYIRSSKHAELPKPGNRVSPANAVLMAKIVSNGPFGSTIRGAHGATKYRLVGLELATNYAATTSAQYNILDLGYDAGGNGAATRAQLVNDIIIDRCYIHGTKTGNIGNAITVLCERFALIDSYLDEIHWAGNESHGVHLCY
jgi:hypothetical protein